MIRITGNRVERFETDLQQYLGDADCFGAILPFAGHVYAGYPAQLKLWKWTDTHFEPAASRGWQLDDVEGWSMRQFALGHKKYSMTLSGEPVTIVPTGETSPTKPLSIALERPGQKKQEIWTFDGRPHRVEKAESERLFNK